MKRQAPAPALNGHAEKKPASSSSGANLGSPLAPGLLEDASRHKLVEEFKSSGPYPHCVIPNFCQDSEIRKIHDELVNNLTADLKESDLFKVYQTCDLANLGRNGMLMELAEKMPQLMALRKAVYSEEFKAFVQEVTGCGELSDQIDCATNLHTQGCHLLCHDDVIGTRKVSYIIYLTSPDEEWTKEDGGALELYPSVSDGTPALIPTKTVVPIFNTMAMFRVVPGYSFHAVQEVYADKPRMSLQGWFHGPKPPEPEAAGKATVNQLLASNGSDSEPFTPLDTSQISEKPEPLPSADIDALGKYLNPVYMKPDAVAQIRSKFEEESSVQLHDFLKPDVAARLMAACQRADARDGVGGGSMPGYDVGMGAEWEAVGPAHMQRYLRYQGAAAAVEGEEAAPGAMLKGLLEGVLQSPAFGRLLKQITGVEIQGVRGQCRRFRAGLDYTVAHYGTMVQKARLNVVLSMVDDKEDAEGVERAAGKKISVEDKLGLWASGEVGAYECYVEAEQDTGAEASDVYRQNEDDGPLVQTLARSNTLSIVLLDQGVMRFVKYVHGTAPGSRWDIAADYECEVQDDEEEGEGAEAK